MTSLILSREEIQGITGMWQHAAQARALSRLKIPFDRRTIDGSCIVGREAANQALCRLAQAQPAAQAANDHQHDEPVWSVK